MATHSTQLRKAEKKLSSAERRLAKIKDDNKESIETATRTAVTMGGAFMVSFFEGRFPDRREVFGVDASLIIGGLLTGAVLMDWAGDQATVIESLGNGSLAVFAATKGFQLGSEANQEAA